MFNSIRTQVLRLLRVPHDPTPPAGAPGSVQVFRAGKNFYKLRLLGWGLGQVGALIGIIFSLVLIDRLEVGVNSNRPAVAPPSGATAIGVPTAPTSAEAQPPTEATTPALSKEKARKNRTRSAAKQIAARWPGWVFPLIRLAELGGLLLYLAQIPLTYAMARLDYELRWYIVTDRSLRIRSGLAAVQESTMSFANVQQVVVSQGPLQRLLQIADVRVQSAGGGGDTYGKGGSSGSLHSGVFHGVDNATEIRDLILERLRQFRETGLGDPDEPTAVETPVGYEQLPATALAAARELLEEARALRRSAV